MASWWKGVIVAVLAGRCAVARADPDNLSRHPRFVAAGAFTLFSATAYALLWRDCSSRNALAGPVLGVAIDHGRASALFGIEGGVGCAFERANLGFEYRAHKGLGYVELDPWLGVGGSFGLGIDTGGAVQGMLGVWEGAPLAGDPLACEPTTSAGVTLAVGYRFTGVHELYATVKAGPMHNIRYGCN